MFLSLLAVTFVIAATTSLLVAWAFHGSISAILDRIIPEELSLAWKRYVLFAVLLVGINGGVRIWDLEKYAAPRSVGESQLALNTDRWALEVYRTLVETLQSIAVALLAFFVIALIAYLVVRIIEAWRSARSAPGAA